MQLQEYARILWRRGWLIVLLAVITAGSAFGFSKIQEQRNPVYKSTIKLLIQPARPDLGQTEATRTLLNGYVSWLDSTYRAQEVIDALELDMTPTELREGHVRISGDNLRFVIQIDVEHEVGDVANDIALKWAELLVQWRNEQNETLRREDRIEAIIIDDPRYVLDSPKTAINTLAGAVLGALIGGGIVFALEYLESGVVRSPGDVERFLDLAVLGAIPPSDSKS
jgi:capsular polysaccharide biosynthesis protein